MRWWCRQPSCPRQTIPFCSELLQMERVPYFGCCGPTARVERVSRRAAMNVHKYPYDILRVIHRAQVPGMPPMSPAVHVDLSPIPTRVNAVRLCDGLSRRIPELREIANVPASIPVRSGADLDFGHKTDIALLCRGGRRVDKTEVRARTVTWKPRHATMCFSSQTTDSGICVRKLAKHRFIGCLGSSICTPQIP